MFRLYTPLLFISTCYATVLIHDWWLFPWWAAYLLSINSIAFLAFRWDKAIAPLDKKYELGIRVPNRVLFWVLGMLGGSLGGNWGIAFSNNKIRSDYRRQRWGLMTLFAVQFGIFIWVATNCWNCVAAFNDVIELATTNVVGLVWLLINGLQGLGSS